MEIHDEICYEKFSDFVHNAQAFLAVYDLTRPVITICCYLKASFETDFEDVCNHFKDSEDRDMMQILKTMKLLKNEYVNMMATGWYLNTFGNYRWNDDGAKCIRIRNNLKEPMKKFIKIVSSELMNRKKTSEKKIEELNGKLKETEKRNILLQRDVEDLHAKRKTSEEKIQNTEKRNILLQRDVEDLQAKEKTSEEKIQEVIFNLQKTEKRNILLQRDVEDLQANGKTSGKKIAELEANLQEMEKRNILLQRDVEDLQAKKETSEKQIKELEANLQEREKRNILLQRDIEDLQVRNDIQESETKNTILQNDIRELETKLQGKDEIIKVKDEQQNHLVTVLKVDIEDRKSKEKDLLKLIADKEEKLKLDYIWTADLKKEKKILDEKMAEFLKEYSVLKTSLDKNKSNEEYLRKRTDELAKDNQSLKAEINNLNKQMESEQSSRIQKAKSKANVIVCDCNNLYENKYSIAKEEFSKYGWNEKVIEEWLLEIFMECFKETKELAEVSKTKVKDLFTEQLLQHPFSNDEREFPHQIEINICQMLQEKPDPSILENLSQKIFIRYTDILKQANTSKDFKDFIDKAVHVTWQVNTCNPPMCLSTSGKTFNTSKHIRMGGHGNHIERFLWPCIYMSEQEYDKGKVLQRGYVIKGDCSVNAIEPEAK